MRRLLCAFSILILAACTEEPILPQAPLLASYEDSFQISTLDFEPKSRVVYQYDDNRKLEGYTFFGYNPDTGKFDEQRSFSLTYDANKVVKMEGKLVSATTPYVTYSYEYSTDGSLSKITEVNSGTGLSSQAIFSYVTGSTVKVDFSFSNGTSFEYEYTKEGGNILSDKTTRGQQLCSDGTYTYDQGPNPFQTLGYVDYTLTNISANNKLTENVNYVGCAFPTLVPESYTYTYLENGYPSTVTTHYKSSGSFSPKAERKFFYK